MTNQGAIIGEISDCLGENQKYIQSLQKTISGIW
jgi:hypothetical protein